MCRHGSKLSNNSGVSTCKKESSHLPMKSKKPHNVTHLPVKSAEKPHNVTFLLNNCTFSGCSVSLSGQATSGSSEECIEEALKNINIDELFDD